MVCKSAALPQWKMFSEILKLIFVSVNLGWVETSNDFSKNVLKTQRKFTKNRFCFGKTLLKTNWNHQKTDFRKKFKI